ncbi:MULTISPECIES: kinase [unclassified Colwellia]|uniref:kinase n=1 Tax=unclassified Colwellia TaxID=196834 RepID=UPI0015F694A6|nr:MULTISPECIES: kinase [unclassified Colwellia]MBA6232633.1 kinase [Colwellia sp. MB02u-7]MBA6235226.1 kinase [Colwellia sp. MB02u-11]MBA6257952.1 kinase [Colwellia sp. MB3u-28]MBA6258368.1 kinase [Colwellia sp. MB3u-41]MBA6299276.1 kinase [Colwellia sp. MB3u-22]
MLSAFIAHHKLPKEFGHTVKQYYRPLADRIYRQFKKNNTPYFVGINGCQGSGKSTLTDFIAEYLIAKYQLNVVVMSLDDFYLTGDKRNKLAHDVHPLLATRGVPGTHDVVALEQVLDQLNTQKTDFLIPKFNKATDEPFPKEQWTVIEKNVDIILLEGWCWGVTPQTQAQLKSPINELELQHDANGQWRNYVNEQLKKAYAPLYKKMDFWLALQAPSFDCVYKWRLEQEQKLQVRNIGLVNSKVMTPEEILNFTQYFQRLSVQSCTSISQSADAIFYLNYARHITEKPVKDEQ